MKHGFPFPKPARDALKEHVRSALTKIERQRFFNEPSYTTALANRLEGVVYDENGCYIEIKSTDVDHQGRGAAEKWSGADMAITAIISNNEHRIEKAILIQAKRGNVAKLPPQKKTELNSQIKKMKQYTKSPKVMQIVDGETKRRVGILSGNKILSNESCKTFDLEDYFVRRILTTLDGDTHKDFVEAVQEHSLCKLRIIGKTPLRGKHKEKKR